MTAATIAFFLLAYATAVSVPGPGLAALLARVLARGPAGIAPFIAGFIIGDLVWFTFAAAGMVTLANTFGSLFTVIKFVGAGYLLFIAYKLITSTPEAVDLAAPPSSPSGAREFVWSLALALGNPKVILFFMALLPTVIDLTSLTLGNGMKLALMICAVQAIILTTYTYAAARARRLFTSRRAVRNLNIGTGTVMAGATVMVATR